MKNGKERAFHFEDFVEDLTEKIWIPTEEEAKYCASEGWKFVGGDLGRRWGFNPKVDSDTALKNLSSILGPPNGRPIYSRRCTQRRVPGKPTWEYLLAIGKTGTWFSIYALGDQLFIGYRFLTEKEFVEVAEYKEFFYVSDEAIIGLCKLIHKIVTGRFRPNSEASTFHDHPAVGESPKRTVD
jgi:hypothetical protein